MMRGSGSSWMLALVCCGLMSTAPVSVSGGMSMDDTCNKMLERIYHSHVTAPIPPDITGIWTSHRCEMRPGPEYLLRKYRFYSNGSFETHQYYYADAYCTKPLFAIVSKGTYVMLRGSWVIPGGTDVDYTLSYVTVIPYDPAVAMEIQTKVNKSCPSFVVSPWRPLERHVIYDYADNAGGVDSDESSLVDRDCTEALHFSLHELQLIRMELRKHHHQIKKELFLGDVHTDRHMRMLHRPTSYQAPLYGAETEGCHVCQAISKADDFYPPKLHHRHRAPVLLPGQWFSERCETRPSGMFLTRRLLFSDDNSTWQGYYYHYTDPFCREPTFTLYARGTYLSGLPSTFVPNAVNFDFLVTHASILPLDAKTVTNLNTYRGHDCGVPGTWRRGVEQDVTETNGCKILGIQIPLTEYEIIRVEREHTKEKLFVGQRPSDGSNPTDPYKRATSFQWPLIQCGSGWSPSRSRVSHKDATAAGRGVNHGPVLPLVLITMLIAFVV